MYRHDPAWHQKLIQANRTLFDRASQEFSLEVGDEHATLELKEYEQGDHGLPGMPYNGDFEMHSRIHMKAKREIDFGIAWSNLHDVPVHFLYDWGAEKSDRAFLVAATDDRDFAKLLRSARKSMEANLRG